MKLLLIEDNPALQTTLQRSFERRGIQMVLCGDGARALDRWRAAVPDVVLLDLGLPGVDGLSVLASARAEGLATPVIVLTARGAVGDRVLGLNTGADDYLIKPFDLDELEARVRALVRRQGALRDRTSTSAPPPPSPPFAGLTMDDSSAAVYLQGQPLDLTAREAALLRALLARPGQAVAKDRLTDLVFPGQADVNADAIEVVVYRLRRKLQAAPAELVTLRGLGYLLRQSR